nr:DNA-directed DNA polymerase [Tanacetum cinerariifolium]
MIQNNVPPKLRDPVSFLISCNFNKTFSSNALADLGASINITRIDVIDEILEEDFDDLLDERSKILISIEGIVLEEENFSEYDKFIAMASNENNDSESDEEEPKFKKITINTYYKIKTSLTEHPMDLELKPLPDNLEYQNPPFHRRNPPRRRFFSEFDDFMAMTADENSKSESDIEEPPFEKITINTDNKITTSLEEPLTDLKLKPLLDNLEYVFLEVPFCLPVIISSKLSAQNKNKLVSALKKN